MRRIQLLGIMVTLLSVTPVFSQVTDFKYKISPIPPSVQNSMKKYTWHKGCPISLTNLSYLKLSYWGFDQKTHEGTMIVNKRLSGEVIAIFKDLYNQKYPIERMQLMDDFQGNDNAAMAANNTSSFNCRPITGQKNHFSLHSFGAAIDVNPLMNPYVISKEVAPSGGRTYLDRNKSQPGLIQHGDSVYVAFKSRGWFWGGDWHSPIDYQHFERSEESSN